MGSFIKIAWIREHSSNFAAYEYCVVAGGTRNEYKLAFATTVARTTVILQLPHRRVYLHNDTLSISYYIPNSACYPRLQCPPPSFLIFLCLVSINPIGLDSRA